MAGGSDENHYLVLGVSKDANAEEIKKAFHKQALNHHPDRNPGDSMAAERFRKVHQAYQVLSDQERRKKYDLQESGYYIQREQFFEPYLHLQADHSTIKLNEEVEITYAFGGEGRFFRKPPLPGFYVAAGPIIDHRRVMKNGVDIRETLLKYIIYPLQTGRLNIPPATISFAHRKYESNSWILHVVENNCYFKSGEKAGEDPLKVFLFREQATSNSIYRKIKLQQHVILVPRSDLVAWYHKVGRIMKIGLTLCGMAWSLVNNYNIIYGGLAGSLIAGINCQLMYKAMGIKSKFYYSLNFPLVNEYLEKGYSFSTTTNEGFFKSKSWQLFKSLFN